jgi:hypothetical protein
MTLIGTVEILRTRVYNLDAECHESTATTVIVEPGKYDLHSDGMSTFWLMRGRLNTRGAWRMGDGTFALNASDERSGIEVVFPSRRFGPDEWADLLATPELTEGHDAQRLRVSLGGVS